MYVATLVTCVPVYRAQSMVSSWSLTLFWHFPQCKGVATHKIGLTKSSLSWDFKWLNSIERWDLLLLNYNSVKVDWRLDFLNAGSSLCRFGLCRRQVPMGCGVRWVEGRRGEHMRLSPERSMPKHPSLSWPSLSILTLYVGTVSGLRHCLQPSCSTLVCTAPGHCYRAVLPHGPLSLTLSLEHPSFL